MRSNQNSSNRWRGETPSIEEPPTEETIEPEVDEAAPEPKAPEADSLIAEEDPPTDGRIVVLMFGEDSLAASAKASRRYVRGQGWQTYHRWIDAMTGLEVTRQPDAWRPWEPNS